MASSSPPSPQTDNQRESGSEMVSKEPEHSNIEVDPVQHNVHTDVSVSIEQPIPPTMGWVRPPDIPCVDRVTLYSECSEPRIVACRLTENEMTASSSLEDIPPPKPDHNAPPPYELVTRPTKLPTYEEVQHEKQLENELLGIPIVNDPSQFRTPPNQRILLPIDNEAAEDIDTSLLGTDFMFYIAFFVAFIFNWIGFLLLMCFCHTIASRYGALSGFGLSLAKWTFIVQHSTELASKDNSWLWWLIMTFGLIICIRAILQYLNIKRGWHMLSASHQERLLFFY